MRFDVLTSKGGSRCYQVGRSQQQLLDLECKTEILNFSRSTIPVNRSDNRAFVFCFHYDGMNGHRFRCICVFICMYIYIHVALTPMYYVANPDIYTLRR